MLLEEGMALWITLLFCCPDSLDLLIDSLLFFLLAQHLGVLLAIVELTDALCFVLLEHLLKNIVDLLDEGLLVHWLGRRAHQFNFGSV